MLIAPLFENGLIERSHRRLIVVPHRMLHYVPFSALPGFDGEPLCAGFAVTLAPSATVWERLRARPRPPVTRLVAVANPDLSYTNLGSLEASEREIEAIERRVPLPVDARVGAEASESFLRAAVPGAGIVHVATHGDFPEQDALDMQRVLLAADEHHDGALRADELRSLDLSAARAVVLSVCNGGLYRFGPGDEPYGLLPAVLGAGAENVVSTLWPIEDRIGRVFMKELYRDLLTAGPAEALRRTASQFRDDGALIRQWAAFTVVGTGRPFDS
jgi:CHAT domain-containing protein